MFASTLRPRLDLSVHWACEQLLHGEKPQFLRMRWRRRRGGFVCGEVIVVKRGWESQQSQDLHCTRAGPGEAVVSEDSFHFWCQHLSLIPTSSSLIEPQDEVLRPSPQLQ